jgi:hypothetical protein
MDGTLVDSTLGVKGAWNLFQESYPTIDLNHILSCKHLISLSPMCYFLFLSDTASHGVRTVENLRNHCGIQDPEILKVSANYRAIDTSYIYYTPLYYRCPSARGGAIRKGHCNHILRRRGSRHYASSGSQIDYRRGMLNFINADTK